MSPLSIESHENVGVLRLNNGVINPISVEMVKKLSSVLNSVRDQFKGLVLAGGEKFFSLGFNIPELLEMDRDGMSAFFLEFNKIVLSLYSVPIPTACAIRGHAIAGGAILLLACDYRVASSGKTLIGLNEIKLGAPTPYLADMILRQIATDQLASEIMYSGNFISSLDAARYGIISETFSSDEVEARSIEKISKMAESNPRAFAESKANRVEVIRARYEANHKIKNEAFIDCWFDPKTQESLREAAIKSFGSK